MTELYNQERNEKMKDKKSTGKIFYLIGKSASGKDTIYQRLLTECPDLHPVIPYTTRPMREGEIQGREYHFVSEEELKELQDNGKVIEQRVYQTMAGPWIYATVDDKKTGNDGQSYLTIGTLESFRKVRDYFGKETVIPLYIVVDDGLRLERALARERQQKKPNYAELCRRFLADEEDFSADALGSSGIDKAFENDDLEQCIESVKRRIKDCNSSRVI